MKKINALALMFLCSFFANCTSEITLSNDEALELLKSQYKTDFCYSFIKNRTQADWNDYDEKKAAFKSVEEIGLIVLYENWVKTGWMGRGQSKEYRWEPTGKGLDYKHVKDNTYKTTEKIITEIKGIVINQQSKTAKVNYSYEYKETPFFKMKRKRQKKCIIGYFEAEDEFQLYDTGWKIIAK